MDLIPKNPPLGLVRALGVLEAGEQVGSVLHLQTRVSPRRSGLLACETLLVCSDPLTPFCCERSRHSGRMRRGTIAGRVRRGTLENRQVRPLSTGNPRFGLCACIWVCFSNVMSILCVFAQAITSKLHLLFPSSSR